MGQPKKKGQSGAAANYISRAKAIKRLQLSLKDFRRLCILKGIYPHEPKHKHKVGGGTSELKTYYYLKDIQFLSHEPLIQKFRYFKVFMRRLKKATDKNELETVKQLRKNTPMYKLDHIIKERYPTFNDALRDLDDSLSMCYLFATFPKSRTVPSRLVDLCRRLTVEFMHYIIESRSLRKVFISIKGFYYQAEVQGETVTWIVPHPLNHPTPSDVDFKIMATFTEFYTTMLGFINFKLYQSLNLFYPPKLSVIGDLDDQLRLAAKDEISAELVCALSRPLNRVFIENVADTVDVDEFPLSDDPEKVEVLKAQQERAKRQLKLFEGLKFFIGREVPREHLVFTIRSFGGLVSWDQTVNIGATYSEDDEGITHQIVDRPMIEQKFTSRYYLQPQWVFDCVNNCMLLPVEDYFPGAVLPPHLSPFVEEDEYDYVPPERQVLLARQEMFEEGEASGMKSMQVESDSEQSGSEEEDQTPKPEQKAAKTFANRRKRAAAKRRRYAANPIDSSTPKEQKRARMSVETGKVVVEDKEAKRKEEAAEEKRLAVLMIPKKKKRVYEKIVYGKRRKLREAAKLKEKRENYNKELRESKRKKSGARN